MKVQPLQAVSWVLLLVLVATFYLLVIPTYGEAALRTILAGVYAGLAGLTVLSAALTMGIDPADQGLVEARRQRKALAAAGAAAAEAGAGGKGPPAAGAGRGERVEEEDGGEQRDDDDDDDAEKEASEAEAGERKRNRREAGRARLTTAGSVVSRSNSTDATIYCYVCRVNVDAASIHCRICSKCVGHFDHHCAWLGQCIGARNYGPFMLTMVSALALLGFQATLTALIIARYSIDRKAYTEQLSQAASWLPVRVQMALLVLVAAGLAPLVVLVGQLLGFHVHLRAQGLTTYEFIVRETEKRRAREEKGAASRELVAMASRQQPGLLLPAVTSPTAAAAAPAAEGGPAHGGAVPSDSRSEQRPSEAKANTTGPPTPENSERKVVLSSSSSSKPSGSGRLLWPFRGFRSRQPPQSLPGDEFLNLAHPDEDFDHHHVVAGGTAAL